LFIQLKTALMETYLKSEKEVLGIKWMEGQKNIQLWKSLKNLIFYESFFVEFINQLWDFLPDTRIQDDKHRQDLHQCQNQQTHDPQMLLEQHYHLQE